MLLGGTYNLWTRNMDKLAKPKGDQKSRFIQAAEAAECDDDKVRFEKRLGKIATAKAPSTKYNK